MRPGRALGRSIAVLPVLLAGAVAAGPLPAPDAVFAEPERAQVDLGRLLFWDPVLSGNRDIACGSCHHPRYGTSDGLSLGLGTGATGVGPARAAAGGGAMRRQARNAPGLFNLGAAEFTALFHDGRVEADPTRADGIRTPLGDRMPPGLGSVLAAQVVFPLLAADEMAGRAGQNEIADAIAAGRPTGPDGALERIAARVAAIPGYRTRFDALADGGEIGFADIANAIAAFVAVEWRADDSRFDRYLRGTGDLDEAEARGMALFFGRGGCDGCHAGLFQTDHAFHAIAMPQIGPGKPGRFEIHARDTGRARVTGRAADGFAFRTPSLRNVALTAPYGHAGAYATLAAVIRHKADPLAALAGYDRGQAVLPPLAGAEDFRIADSPAEIAAIAAANRLRPVALDDRDIADLVAFLNALTDARGSRGRLGIPATVPSGLPVPR